ncbi:DUF1659 domain-containing protein [Bacillus sp. JJ722]|uniref:DUF1659 domain-containing protein n=1 Tax=Bacillus sp. JJ722 TaxID=3122973 RepID=UPI002FFE1760
MANETLLSKQLRLTFQTGVDGEGKPILTRKTFSNIEPSATTEQLLVSAKAIASLQVHPTYAIEQQELQSIEG